MKLGYAGGQGSFAEQAAKQLLLEHKVEKTYSAIHAEMLLARMLDGELDAILLPLKYNAVNSGTKETERLVRAGNLELVDTIEITSQLCLFSTQEAYRMSLSFIAGPYAYLKHTRKARNKRWTGIYEIEVDNAAPIGYLLATGQLSKDIAILCTKEEGTIARLQLLDEGLTDNTTYTVTYGIYRRT